MDPRVSSNLFTRRNFLSIAAGFAATAAGLGLTACNNAPSSPSTPATEEKKSANTSYPVSFKLYDGDGNEFEAKFDKAPESVVTLTDSAAEILLRLGLGSKIIGTIKPDAPMPSDIADEYANIKQLGDKKSLSREVVVAANPNLIVGRSRLFTSKDQTSPKDYADLGISVYTQLASSEQGDPTLAGIISDIKNLGAIFDVQSNADTYTADLQKRLDAINERVKAHEKDAKKTVLVMTNLKDGTFGLFGGSEKSLEFTIIDQLGATPATTQSANGLTYENLIKFNPDVIIYVTAERNKATDAVAKDTLLGESSLQNVPAIANNSIVEIPYSEYIDYSPRAFDSAEKILEVLYPQK